MSDAKRWLELECRHCRGRFIDMVKLLFHHCPGRTAQNNVRSRATRLAKGKVAISVEGLSPAAERTP